MRLRKNFSKKKKFGQFLARSGSGSGSETGSISETNFRPDPDPKQDPKLLFRIRNTDGSGSEMKPMRIYNTNINIQYRTFLK